MEEICSDRDSKEKIFAIFKDFMARVAQFEELVTVGSKFLSGIQQGLGLLQRPAIDKSSKLIANVIETNDTKNIRLYFGAGCINTHDGVQSANKSRSLVDELERLMGDVNIVMQTARLSLLTVLDEDGDKNVELNEKATAPDKNMDITEYAVLMGIINFMVKKDYIMQEKIISGINLKSSSEELESYCLYWSLRPFIDDEILQQAWKLIP